MNESLIVLLCFLPLIVIFIAVKVYLLITETKKEINYVTSESKKPHGSFVENSYEDVDEPSEDYWDK